LGYNKLQKAEKNRMKNIVLILFISFISFNGIGQNNSENILYIIDEIPILENPDKDDDELSENDIESLTVITDKIEIKSYTSLGVDKIISIKTKLFAKRSDSVKSIPTTKRMKNRNGTWYLNNAKEPYSGKFIDYFSTGKIWGEGTFFNGSLKGLRKIYYSNGQLSLERNYDNGISHGIEKQFYKNGVLEQQGEFNNGKEIGTWEMYHPNGQLKQKATFNENGKMEGDVITYYSTGEIMGKSNYKNGVYQKDKISDKLYKLYNESQNLYKQVNYKGAIRKLDSALELDSNWAEGYFARGTMRLNDFQFDEAIQDFDKALEIEPYFTKAYSNRAFAVLRKHELGSGRTISKSKDIQIIASKETEIPEAELTRICTDLKKAVSLGDDNSMVLEAIEKYCKE
jgi:antitoxin component YwqK of YwqJK toxin-antitoxin module